MNGNNIWIVCILGQLFYSTRTDAVTLKSFIIILEEEDLWIEDQYLISFRTSVNCLILYLIFQNGL